MAPIVDLESDKNIVYLMKVPLLPFGEYDKNTFPYNVLNTLYRHWFGDNINKIMIYNENNHNLTQNNVNRYCQTYHVIKRDLMEFFEAGRESWINDKSRHWNNKDRFKMLSSIIQNRTKKLEHLLNELNEANYHQNLSDCVIHHRNTEIRLLRKTNYNLTAINENLIKLNENITSKNTKLMHEKSKISNNSNGKKQTFWVLLAANITLITSLIVISALYCDEKRKLSLYKQFNDDPFQNALL